MGKSFDLQDPAANMLSGSIPSAGSRMAQRSKASPAGGWAARTAAASVEKAKAEAKAEEAAKAEAEARAKSAEPTPEDVSRAWEQAGRPNPPEGHILNRAFVETKSKRLQVLMQPSVYERVHARAKSLGVSVNEMISRLLILGLESMEG